MRLMAATRTVRAARREGIDKRQVPVALPRPSLLRLPCAYPVAYAGSSTGRICLSARHCRPTFTKVEARDTVLAVE